MIATGIDISLVETREQENIARAILGAPTQFPDLAPAKVDFLIRGNDCYLVEDQWGLIGLWMMSSRNEVLAEVHIAMLPTAFGERALAGGRAFRDFIWSSTGLFRVVANIAIDNRSAAKYAEKVGFSPFAVNPRAMRKRGHLTDVVMYGITRTEL